MVALPVIHRPLGRPARRSVPSSTADARERLVQAALAALLEHGPAGFKVLDVAARAEANVALINYHFGGRDGLLREVLRRKGAVLAEVRLARLEALLAACAPELPAVAKVVQAWLQPVFESVQHHQSGSVHALLSHLLFATDMTAQSRCEMVAEVLRVDARFIEVLARCRPDLSRRSLAWRMAGAVGSYNYVFGAERPTGLDELAGEPGPPATMEEAYQELLAFIVGGFDAPASVQPAKKKSRRSGHSR